MSRMTITLAALPLLFASSSLAQVRVDLAPCMGLYYTTGDLARFQAEDQQFGTVDFRVSQKPAFLLGGQVAAWLNRAWGLEGSLAYSFSGGEIRATAIGFDEDICDDPGTDCSAHVWLASGRILHRIAPSEAWALLLGIGMSVVGRGGRLYDDTQGGTDVGGVLSAGVVFDLSPSLHVRMGIEDIVYSFAMTLRDEDFGTIDTDSRLQNDLALSAGLVFALGQR